MRFLLISMICIFPLFSLSGEIKKIKNDKIVATVDEFTVIGDILLIKDYQDNTRGKARVLKIKNNKALLKFKGEVKLGWEIISREDSRSIASTSNNIGPIYESNLPNYSSKNYKTISTGQYIAGGAMGILLGIGIGHAVQGRYSERGWIFTVSQIGSGIALGYYLAAENEPFVIISAISLIGFRIWELIDVWWLPSTYKVTSKKENTFSISPALLYSYNSPNMNTALGFSIKYVW